MKSLLTKTKTILEMMAPGKQANFTWPQGLFLTHSLQRTDTIQYSIYVIDYHIRDGFRVLTGRQMTMSGFFWPNKSGMMP